MAASPASARGSGGMPGEAAARVGSGGVARVTRVGGAGVVVGWVGGGGSRSEGGEAAGGARVGMQHGGRCG